MSDTGSLHGFDHTVYTLHIHKTKLLKKTKMILEVPPCKGEPGERDGLCFLVGYK